MANRTSNLVVNSNIPGVGWRRGLLVKSKNGKYRPGWMVYNGQEYEAPNAIYQIRHYEGSKAVYTRIGTDMDEALATYDRYIKTVQVNALNKELGIAIEPEPKQEVQKTTIEQHKETFLKKRAVGSKANVALYNVVIGDFCKFVAARGKTLPEQIVEDDITDLFGVWKSDGRAQYTCANRYSNLRGFLRYMKLDPKELIDATEHNKMKFKPRSIPEIYTDDQIDRLIAASSERHGLVWESYLKTGFRDEELAFLEWREIDWSAKTVQIRRKPKGSFAWNPELEWKPKDNEERQVPLEEGLLQKLKAWHEKNPNTRFVFGTLRDRPDIKFLKALKSDWRRASLNCGQCPGCLGKRNECGDAFLHKFRATYLTRMLSHCDNPRDVMALAGHSSLETSLHYLRPSAMPAMQRAVNAAWS